MAETIVTMVNLLKGVSYISYHQCLMRLFSQTCCVSAGVPLSRSHPLPSVKFKVVSLQPERLRGRRETTRDVLFFTDFLFYFF